jgi:hypothetical protein
VRTPRDRLSCHGLTWGKFGPDTWTVAYKRTDNPCASEMGCTADTVARVIVVYPCATEWHGFTEVWLCPLHLYMQLSHYLTHIAARVM